MKDRKKIRENARKAREQKNKKAREDYIKTSARNRVASEKEVAAQNALKKELKRQRSGSSIDSKKILTKKPAPSGKSSDFLNLAYNSSKADWTSKETPNY